MRPAAHRHPLPSALARLVFLALLAPAPAAEAPAAPPLPAGPPARQGLRLPEMPVHDPWILAHEETKTYHLYSMARRREGATNRCGTLAYTSRDLLNWDGPHTVFLIPDGCWAAPGEGAWAPEVHRHNGKYCLFVTLHNASRVIDRPPDAWRVTHLRGTTIAVADSPAGPFALLRTDGPVAPDDFMTLDGTLFVEDGTPWLVYAHEWIQVIDGTIEAVPLTPDLSAAAGEPIHLFKGSDAPWINANRKPSKRGNRYVTDGPELFRTKTGRLLMLWSSYGNGGYVQTLARSESGRLAGPWTQLPPLVGNDARAGGNDSGHGMLFRTFEGQLMMVLHQPFNNARAKLYDIEDTGDSLRVLRARDDLHGAPPAPRP